MLNICSKYNLLLKVEIIVNMHTVNITSKFWSQKFHHKNTVLRHERHYVHSGQMVSIANVALFIMEIMVIMPLFKNTKNLTRYQTEHYTHKNTMIMLM